MRNRKGGYKYINDSVLIKWFSPSTNPDRQLKTVIQKYEENYEYPNYVELSNTLFNCNNLYDEYKLIELIPPMEYPSHISDRTITCLDNILASPPQFGIEVGSFIGSSAKMIGEYVKKCDGILMCIDT
jgi:hypothetical protein